MTYEIETIDNHIIFKENNLRLLLDTGSPISISNHSSISVFSKTINPHRNIMGHTSINDINQSIRNANIDALIGADILNKISLSISLSNKLMELKPVINHNQYDSFPLSTFMGIPMIVATINGKEAKLFLDTGAKISYLNSNSIQVKNIIRVAEDFYPGFGNFETNIYQHQIKLFNQIKKYDFGTLPESLETSLSMLGTNGIIGNNILMNFDLVLDNPKNQILIKNGSPKR
tara:strand:+ start:14122 stop:14814 length:693 start_codon:yes stop_codon:yes gene_type:complete